MPAVAKKPTKRGGYTDPNPTSATMDVLQLSAALQSSVRHIYRQVDEGRIPAPAKIGALNRWSRQLIEQWIADGCPVPSSK